jgi:type I restriction enzyme R subunit
MSNRPAIPIDIQREVLFEARQRCAVCCEPTPLERAHIRPWGKSQDHSAPNLIALCANCHTRADTEDWGAKQLKRYKQNPCALAVNSPPVVTSEQQAIIDLVIANDPDSMTRTQRLRIVSMVAAYAGAWIGDIQLISISPANSTRLRLKMPATAATKLEQGFERSDPLLKAFLDDFVLLGVSLPEPAQGIPSHTTDTSEKGLETLIMRHMTGVDGLVVAPGVAGETPDAGGAGYFAGSPKDYDRAQSLDVLQLFAFLRRTQPETFKRLAMTEDPKDINRIKFLARLSNEIGKRGVIDVLRKGVDHGPLHFDLFYGTPSEGNVKACAPRAESVLNHAPACLQHG